MSTKRNRFCCSALAFLLLFAIGFELAFAQEPVVTQPEQAEPVVKEKAANDLVSTVRVTKQRIAKIYGAGGIKGLEAYQTGIVISSTGHILTVWSHVLDSDVIAVMLDDGRRFEAKLIGHDPRLEIAVIKIEVEELDYFDYQNAVKGDLGSIVLAFSNLYNVATGNEPVSVQHGSISAFTNVSGRRGASETRYPVPVYVVDAMTSNPGAAGGALTNRKGELLGLIGKDLKNAESGIWINFAIPTEAMKNSIDQILEGKILLADRDGNEQKPNEALSFELLGITLVPNVVGKTPPFVDRVRIDSPAAKAGLKSDDLVVAINDRLVVSRTAADEELSFIQRDMEIQLTIQRGTELITVVLGANQ